MVDPLKIEHMICQLGFNEEGSVVLKWPLKRIKRKELSPGQLVQLVAAIEAGASEMITELCGGKQ